MKWTREMRWHEIVRAAAILHAAGVISIVPDFKRSTMLKLNAALNNSPNIGRRKTGKAQSSPVYYRAKLDFQPKEQPK